MKSATVAAGVSPAIPERNSLIIAGPSKPRTDKYRVTLNRDNRTSPQAPTKDPKKSIDATMQTADVRIDSCRLAVKDIGKALH
jgi:hypothetical protein